VAEFFDDASEEFVWDLCEDAGAVAGFGVGIKGAAVGEVADGADGDFEYFVGAAAVDVGDESDSAGVVFVVGVVEGDVCGFSQRVVNGLVEFHMVISFLI